MKKKYNSFAEFYPYYLSEHQHPTCRLLHFIGSALIVCVIVVVLFTANFTLLWLLPVLGYGFAWLGHFFFEHNKPATFDYPLYSLVGDWVMFKDMLLGKISFKS